MTVLNSSRGHSTTRKRRKLRKEIKESLIIYFFGSIGTLAFVALWIGSVIQTMGRIG
jgi:hypothetical protein